MIKKLILGLFVVNILIGCTSSQDEEESEATSEVSEEVDNIENTENVDEALNAEEEVDEFDEQAVNEAENKQTQNEQSNQEEQFADEQALEDELGEEEPVVQEEPPIEEPQEVPPPVIAEEPLENVLEAETPQEAPVQAAERVKITGLDFKGNQSGGTIVVTTSGVPTYKTEENAGNNQFVLEIENAVLPKQFARPYNTKEFSGPIGLINAFKVPGTQNARIVVQLKKPTSLSVVQEGNTLLIVPGESVAESAPVVEPEVQPSVEMSAEDEQQALQSKTLDEFLMGETKFYGKKISVEITDAEIRDVINFISEESGVNLVLSDDVKGKISVKLRQIPWDQALVVIMQSKQLGYIRQGNILRIAPLLAIRQETDNARQLIEAQKLIEPLRTRVFPVSYAKAKELEPQVATFLSTRGSAKADERMNSIVIKDIAENIAKIEKLIERLDAQTPQVLIEGKIVETRETYARELGINMSITGSLGFGRENISGIKNGVGIPEPVTTSKFATSSIIGSLRLLEDDNKVKILSSPRVVVLNNQTATIEQANQFPIVTTTNNNGVTTETVEYKTVKLSLNVTPQIAADGGVILKTDILREFAGAEDSGAASTTGARAINSRTAKSTVLVDNGQTAVLGGIFQSDNAQSKTGVPLLKDIPILGYLFGQETVDKEKNELIIFLTPRILNRDRAFQLSDSGDDSSKIQ